MKQDTKLSPEQSAQVGSLSDSEIEQIDSKLLGHTNNVWRKVAKIVGLYMESESTDGRTLPDVYLASRIYAMTESRNLEVRGIVGSMRYCEVRARV